MTLNMAIGCQLVTKGCVRHEMSGLLMKLLRDTSTSAFAYFATYASIPLLCLFTIHVRTL